MNQLYPMFRFRCWKQPSWNQKSAPKYFPPTSSRMWRHTHTHTHTHTHIHTHSVIRVTQALRPVILSSCSCRTKVSFAGTASVCLRAHVRAWRRREQRPIFFFLFFSFFFFSLPLFGLQFNSCPNLLFQLRKWVCCQCVTPPGSAGTKTH